MNGPTSRDYFKMGAVTAVGELYAEGLLGSSECRASEIRRFLGSFGIEGIDDMRRLGMRGLYLRDFEQVYGESVDC